ncbi:hypothetical protein PHAVU_006G186400 [Phaseolus vulgaris]|uniref:Uncharacterized protein n=1 Tax=Phaseolus vulgaris TaxID=3885 RepID=V7BT11_PHAVU|nr:hypothetical protein PHAVU_006G186400g [Phaseolus vulgaris]ESW20168.1 hypothetical protein PHAVU_006G186400g [Phaseolus vulgaris]
MSIGVDPGRCRSESTRVDVDRSWHGMMLFRGDLGQNRPASVWVDLNRNRHRPIRIEDSLGETLLRSALADFRSWHVSMSSDRSGPLSMSSRVRLGRCHVESTLADIERSRSGSMLTGVGQVRYQPESARVDVDRRQPGPIFRVGLGKCRAQSFRVDFDQSRSGLMSSRVVPSVLSIVSLE